MQHVEVAATPLERLGAILPRDRAERLAANAELARASFGDRVVWQVNATAQGGGVAEMLQTLLGYGRGAGIDIRWLVLDGDPEFFTITKRLHNLLHGEPGDGGPLGTAECDHYAAVLRANLDHMLEEISPGDIVLLHDPQTAGLADGLRRADLRVVWRCHVGRDEPNELTDRAWAFLRPFLEGVDAYVFSRQVYAPEWVDRRRLTVIAPSVDPFSAKNVTLTGEQVRHILVRTGLVSGPDPDGPLHFDRRDGTPGRVRRHNDLLLDGTAPPADAPLLVQVSRWDRLKDMAGVMEGFARWAASDPASEAHLMLVGPAVAGVTDDPEGAEVLAECIEQWGNLPPAVRPRVHLASIPMDDVDENAVIVNALQRHAYAVVQKSLVEGFGLTVTEAMWKARPVVASDVGGIHDQIVDGRDGLLLEDPYDLDEFARAIGRLLADPALAERLGAAARQRVLDEFLGDRHLAQYVELFGGLVGAARE